MNRYEKRGVSATKDEVHKAIQHLDKGLYPLAFCKILPDAVGGSRSWCNIMHADTAGTKTSLAYLYWRETGNLDVWKGIAQDALVMNTDDMLCVGCTGNIVISSTIGRNKNLIPGEVISAIIEGTSEFLDEMSSHGVSIHHAGGETADVGDIVRTADVGFTAFARMKRSELIVNRIKPGDVIVGLASYGQSSYETTYNSGIGSNGLTSARHDVLHKDYGRLYPDSYDHHTPEDVVFCGSRHFSDVFEGHAVHELLLSPTRTFLPVMRPIISELRPYIHGLIHCTGGGQGKVKKFIKNCHVIKDNLLPVPPVFRLIQAESGATNAEMYRVFNMGTRMEIYVPEMYASQVISIAGAYGIEAQVIGRVEKSTREKVTVVADGEALIY